MCKRVPAEAVSGAHPGSEKHPGQGTQSRERGRCQGPAESPPTARSGQHRQGGAHSPSPCTSGIIQGDSRWMRQRTLGQPARQPGKARQKLSAPCSATARASVISDLVSPLAALPESGRVVRELPVPLCPLPRLLPSWGQRDASVSELLPRGERRWIKCITHLA